ncbi:MAG: Stage 0 sporulation protein A [Firmicutes bacterium ADurb.Bin182]|nr:MAG: Stage 0 sporulation protein A [Firmicutes bacterium ADurb.Bin182]
MCQIIKAMVVDDNEQILESISDFFAMKGTVQISGLAGNSLEAIELFEKNRPDIIILDLVMPKADGFVLLEYLRSLKDGPKPEVIVLTSLSNQSTVQRACDYGASYFIAKPFSVEVLYKRILDIFEVREKSEPIKIPNQELSISDHVSSLLLKTGISPKNKGYQFLSHAVNIVIKEPELINSLTKQLYPRIAEFFNTKPSNVERAIRHSIETAWANGRFSTVNKLLNYDLFDSRYKPTNGEFISHITQLLSLNKNL